MTRRDRLSRLSLVLAYAVLTVWAQAGDRHGHDTPAESRCDAACRDPRPHFSGHPSPDLGQTPSDCPACQLRSNLHAPTPTVAALGGTLVDRVAAIAPVEPTCCVVGIPSCRGPPRI